MPSAEAAMHPWITGRIIETMQHDARARGERERLGHEVTARRSAPRVEPRQPRRTRVGLAVARAGLRLAGRDPTLPATAAAVPVREADPSRWSTSWTTCGAGSPSPR
jgi:hypothetical protein